MPVSSLIVTLRTEPAPDAVAIAAAAARLLRALPFVELGDPEGVRFPAVLEGDSYREHDDRLEALRNHPDVAFVDLVSHDFSDVEEFGDMPRRRRRKDGDE